MPLLFFALLFAEPALAQDDGNRAGLVVVHGDGRVTTRCVSFAESQISGSELLSRSGLAFGSVAGPTGVTVCSLNGEGCPGTDCFCECHGTPCVYWIYYHGNPDGSWTYANIGAALRQLSNGDVDAWLWGEASQLPPALTFDAICSSAPPSLPAPTSTSAAVDGAPAPTATPVAIATMTATMSPTPVATPTATLVPATSVPIAVESVTPTPLPLVSETPTKVLEDETTPDAPSYATVSPVPLVEPTESVVPELFDNTANDPTGQIVAFVVVLGVLGGAFALLSRRSGAR